MNPDARRRKLIGSMGKASQVFGIGHDGRQSIGDNIAMRQPVVTAEDDDGQFNPCASQLDPFFNERHRKAPDFLFERTRASDGTVTVRIGFDDSEQARLGATNRTAQDIGVAAKGSEIDFGHGRTNVGPYVEYLIDGPRR